MKLLKLDNIKKLSDLSQVVGSRNLDKFLVLNNLTRNPDILSQIAQIEYEAAQGQQVPTQRKATILNTMVQDSDIFESAALLGSAEWKILNQRNALPGTLFIPDDVKVSDASSIMGDGVPVKDSVYREAMSQLKATGSIDSSVFNQYAVNTSSVSSSVSSSSGASPFQYFHIPWGMVTISSSITGEYIDFPVYPEEVNNSIKANYTQMPELLYQYEPWMIYTSSGPRSNTYSFEFHRDMWTGDHRDGKANELIRFCESFCYPDFNGSAVNVPIVTLFVAGKVLISGVVTEVNTNWSGPIGLDGWYLVCKLEVSITEISQQALNHRSVRNKSIIG